MLDTETGQMKMLTRDDGDKTDPYGWLAPDHNNQLLVLAVVNDSAIAIYKDKGGEYWDRIATLTVPRDSNNRIVASAEPFTVAGKSYMSLSIKSEKSRIGKFVDGEVWIFGIEDDPNRRFVRRCDSGERPVVRFDPEVYVGKEEAFLYYNVLSQDRVFEIWRCRTGISVK